MKKRLIAMVLALCVFAGVMLDVPAARAASGYAVYVVSNTLKVYQTPSTSAKLMGTMGYGESMTCIAVSGSWAMVRNASGTTGYCAFDALATSNPNTLNVAARINTANAPLYRIPSTGSAVWMKLPKGASFTAVAMTRDNNWIRLKNGNYYGYMQAKYLTTAGTTPTPAPTGAPASDLTGKVYVTVTELKVYASASTSGRYIGPIYYGQDMTCLSASGSWAKVRNSNGTTGYCQISGISKSNPNNLSQKVYVSADRAPIYRVPSTGAAVWMNLKKNESYTAVAVTPDGVWTRIQNGGYFAYIPSKYLSNAPSAPAPTPEPAESISGTYFAAATIVAVYETASDSAKSLGVLSYGESTTVSAVSGGWAKVKSSAGTAGYCRFSELSDRDPNTLSRTVYINADSAPIYRIASESGAVWMTLKKNDSYKAVAVTPDGAWYRLQNGAYFAYISSKFISDSKVTNPAQTVYVTAAALPVYAGASASSKLLGTMCVGESMTLIGASDGWAKVRNASGAVGYCLVSGLTDKDINTLNKPYYADKNAVKLYTRSYSGASAVKSVSMNTSLMVVCVSSDGAWARVLLNNGSFAYVKMNDLSEARVDDGTQIKDISSVTVYVIPTSLVVYASTSTGAKSLGTMYFGQSMVCTGKSSKWARVVNSAGTVGYCDVESVTTVNPNTYASTFYAQVNGAKIYKSPAATSSVLSALSLNAQVTAVTYNSERTWYRVKWNGDYGYVEARFFATSRIADSGQSSTIAKVLSCAKQYMGVPYVYGGRSPGGFDCSGFVYYVFKNAAGITLNLTAYTQGYDERYQKITNIVDLKAGDVLFFNTVDDNDLSDHAGIYLGNNQFIHASSAGGKVIISSLGTNSSSYYYRTYSWGRRIIK